VIQKVKTDVSCQRINSSQKSKLIIVFWGHFHTQPPSLISER